MSIAGVAVATVAATLLLLYLAVAAILFLVGTVTWMTASSRDQEEAGKEAIRWSPVWPYRMIKQIFLKG